MFTSKDSKLSMLANPQEFLMSRFKWIGKEEDCENSDAAVIELESRQEQEQNKQPVVIEEVEENSNSAEQGSPNDESETEESPLESYFSALEEQVKNIGDSRVDAIKVDAQEHRENEELTSFEVIQSSEIYNISQQCQKGELKQIQCNGFGDTGDTAVHSHVYELATKTSASVKSFFTSFLEETRDGCIVPIPDPPPFQKDLIVIGDLFSSAVQGLKTGVSFLLGDAKKYRKDTVHYRGYKIRTKGMELFLDAGDPEDINSNYGHHDRVSSSSSDRKVQFQFKLSSSNRFWQSKEERTIISLPLNVYWVNQMNSTSLVIKVFDSELEVEIPEGVPKDSVIVSCDPDQGTLSIVAPMCPQFNRY